MIPVIEERYFNSPFFLGSYCADNGTLWVNLDDEKNIFKNKKDAENRLQEVIKELFV